MNTASNNSSKHIPSGAPVAGNAARRAAFQSTAHLGRRVRGAGIASPVPAVQAAKPATAPAVPLERVLATYNMFRAA